MKVEVAYAGSAGTLLVGVELADGAVLAEAVDASGIVERLGLVPAALGLAIHGQRARPSTPLREGDRVELLEPLRVDPKEARRARASTRPVPRAQPRKKRRGG